MSEPLTMRPQWPKPGGNETGLIVHQLPLPTARALQQGGIGYLATLPPNAGDDRGWRGGYDAWHPTPLSAPGWLKGPGSGAAASTARIGSYLNRCGFAIDVDPAAALGFALDERSEPLRGAPCERALRPRAPWIVGAGCPNRTDDLPLTRRLLYRLS